MAFTGIWNRYACCPENQSNWPTPKDNMLIFKVNGYNYQTIPEFFDEVGHRMMPLQFSNEARRLLYTYVFYQTIPPENTHYFLATFDDVMPVIMDGKTDTPFVVDRYGRHNGYTMWLVRK